MSVKVYSAYWEWTLNAGQTNNASFSILNNNREMQIKSITIDHQIINTTANSVIPLAQNTGQYLRLFINSGNKTISNSFVHTAGGFSIPQLTGTGFYLTKAGQTKFDSFFIMSDVNFILECTNYLLDDIQNRISIIVEVNEKNVYL